MHTKNRVFSGICGRIGLSCLVALSVVLSVGADSTSSPPPGLSPATSGNSLGEGQSWYDVTGSRFPGAYYYNTDGRAIQVQINIGIESRGGSATFYVNGAVVGTASNNSSTDNNTSFNAVIPPGNWYMVQKSGGRTNVNSWSELR